MNTDTYCLCGSELNYQDCCHLYHKGIKTPSTAEKLMRSRFTAYAMQKNDYLIETWAISKRPKQINFEKEEAQWQRLEIIKTKKGQLNDSRGIVEFKAYFLSKGTPSVMNEISRFTKTGGRWFYLDGQVKSVNLINKSDNQGKNAACSCGSGKKFKRCCGK